MTCRITLTLKEHTTKTCSIITIRQRYADHFSSLHSQNPEASEASLRVTGSVGGRWEKPKDGTDVDTHKPVVTTWGVFERPKDMSKAFGGGRDPTLKKADPEEARRRDEETQAILRR